MEITFYGAAGEVTGSMHLLDTGNDKILMDCGMFQGRRKESNEKNRNFPLEPKLISNMILSHAHIDHSGRIPILTKNFSGRVITTRPTADALSYMLPDSGHIQESDAQYLNYKSLRALMYKQEHSRSNSVHSSNEKNNVKKLLKKNASDLNIDAIKELQKKNGMEIVEPLYTEEEARQALGAIEGYPFRYPVTIGKNTTVKFYIAGHILGSAFSLITVRHDNKISRILYTGDIGRFGKPILQDPTLDFDEEDREIDLLITESTYGDREHEAVENLAGSLKKVMNETFQRGGCLIIPSFAFGRTQELIYLIHELYDNNQVPRMPVYVDSPLASNLTKVFGDHPECYDKDTHQAFLKKGINPFYFNKIRFVQTVEESMRLNKDENPHVVISASGMCEAGRILHHLRHKIHNPKNTILLVGYMAENTLGRRLEDLGTNQGITKDKTPMLKILGKEYPLKAKVEKISGFSAHADKNELEKVITKSNLKIKKIAVVHGEPSQSATFAERLRTIDFEVSVPKSGDKIIV